MPRRSKYSSRAIERRNSSSVANGRFCTPCPTYEDIGDGEDIFTGEDAEQDLEQPGNLFFSGRRQVQIAILQREYFILETLNEQSAEENWIRKF